MKRGNSFILQLAKANNKKNRKNVVIMIMAIALVVLGIFSVFTLILGKIKIDSLKIARENGTVASGMLSESKEKQFTELQKLSYIEKVGKAKKIGVWTEEKEEIAQILVCDEDTFRNFYIPAYTNIVGEYPKDNNEIMVSRSV